ncbi:MAG: site-specific DNA-methyltransferase [Armatimonadetes bacterium]|nr:site-specific DNA-methyltransferase [Armatimonadota bacterium]
MTPQLVLPDMEEEEASSGPAEPSPPAGLRDSSFERNKQSSVHRWVPWIAGFSAGFVADVFQQYLPDPGRRDVTILEPFSGVGTTLVEGMLHGYNVVGFEINPYAALASRVKCAAFRLEPEDLRHHLIVFEHRARQRTAEIDAVFAAGGDVVACAPPPRAAPPPAFRSRVPFFSPAVERKVLHCLDIIHELPSAEMRELLLLAFGAVMVSFSNYSYEPSLGSRVAAGKPEVPNADVVGVLAAKMRAMLDDLVSYRAQMARFCPPPTARVIPASSLALSDHLAPDSADLVVTSPPYLNNYHYIRNTRPHLFWLNFVAASGELKKIETANFGKYWQTVRDAPRSHLRFALPELEERIQAIGEMHPEKGIYGGGGWANYAVEYFNDCHRIGVGLQYALKPGGVAVFVLGNSITQGIELVTDRYFGQIGELCGLHLEDIHLLREKRVGNSVVNSSVRNGQPTKATLYETAVVLRKPK